MEHMPTSPARSARRVAAVAALLTGTAWSVQVGLLGAWPLALVSLAHVLVLCWPVGLVVSSAPTSGRTRLGVWVGCWAGMTTSWFLMLRTLGDSHALTLAGAAYAAMVCLVVWTLSAWALRAFVESTRRRSASAAG